MPLDKKPLEIIVTGEKLEGSRGQRASAALGSKAESAAKDAQRRLDRLMPYDEWCAAVKPTEAAKDLYMFVRDTLETRAEEAFERARNPSMSRSRGRKPKLRNILSGE